jgi:hypothetical protein
MNNMYLNMEVCETRGISTHLARRASMVRLIMRSIASCRRWQPSISVEKLKELFSTLAKSMRMSAL